MGSHLPHHHLAAEHEAVYSQRAWSQVRDFIRMSQPQHRREQRQSGIAAQGPLPCVP